jgi:acetyltransferase
MLPQEDILLAPETVRLADGSTITIRPIHPDDADDLQNTFMRLSTQSIYLRFLSYKKVLTDEEALRLATVDYNTQMAFVATMLENGHEIVVGVSRYALLDKVHPKTAESAVIVGDEFQGRGIGKLLLWKLVDYAMVKGFNHLRGNLDMGNTRMLDLIKRSGLPHKQRYVDGIWEVNIDIRAPRKEV